VVLKPVLAPKFRTFKEIASFLSDKFPDAAAFPEPPPRPSKHERPAPDI
jgi:hypothetical protein